MKEISKREILSDSLGIAVNDLSPIATHDIDKMYDLITLNSEKELGTDAHGRANETAINRSPSATEIDDMLPKSDGHFRVYFTHDVDRVTTVELTSLVKSLLYRQIDGYPAWVTPFKAMRGDLILETTRELIALEKRYGVTSWFFMLSGNYGVKPFQNKYDIRSAAARRFIETVLSGGCHIGLHGSYMARDLNSYKDEAALLGNVAGQRIIAHRNHYLRFDRMQIWEQLENAGIQYDFSIGYVGHCGFRAGTARSFRGIKPNGDLSAVNEIPLIFLERNRHIADIPATIRELSVLLDKAKAAGGSVSILLHPETFLLHKKWWELYEQIIQLCIAKKAIVNGELGMTA